MTRRKLEHRDIEKLHFGQTKQTYFANGNGRDLGVHILPGFNGGIAICGIPAPWKMNVTGVRANTKDAPAEGNICKKCLTIALERREAYREVWH